ncbi:hypothetical protein JXA40_09595 [bacterium]|nr:hypothetical protein [candidate division CSSED10-310 bacterium]
MMTDRNQRCTRCILPANYPAISFDETGVCSFCRKWEMKWRSLDFNRQETLLESILSRYRGRSEPYDCLIGLSGGKDSCYAAYVLMKRNLHPLACTFDNGFMTDRALHNISSTVKTLRMDHVFIHHHSRRLPDLYRHFMLTAGEFCSVCNVGIRAALYRMARSYGIDLIVSGHSIRTEANSPGEFFTCSSGYFHNVAGNAFSHKTRKGFVHINQIERVISHIQRSPHYLQLPSFMIWKEEEFIPLIERELNWQGLFGRQHTDCRMSDAKEYLKLKKFGVVELTAKLSSLVRDGQLSRDEALRLSREYSDGLMEHEAELRDQIRTEFDLTGEQLDRAIQTTHTRFISRTDTALSALKSLYERIRFGRC